MKIKHFLIAGSIAAVLVAIICGCVPAKLPFLSVQVCLTDPQGLSDFKGEMQSIARIEGLELVDNSVNTQKDLERINNPNVNKMLHGGLINMGMRRDDKYILMMGNLGLPPNQVLVSFFEYSNAADAKRFADLVMKELEEHWHLETLSPGTGATGMKDCK